MSFDRFPSMHEDLSADPEHARVQALLAEMISEGTDPKLVVDAALTTATALHHDLAGTAATACRLMQVGATLAQHEPAMREAAQQFSAALQHAAEGIAQSHRASLPSSH